jgi:hypothetical protein
MGVGFAEQVRCGDPPRRQVEPSHEVFFFEFLFRNDQPLLAIGIGEPPSAEANRLTCVPPPAGHEDGGRKEFVPQEALWRCMPEPRLAYEFALCAGFFQSRGDTLRKPTGGSNTCCFCGIVVFLAQQSTDVISESQRIARHRVIELSLEFSERLPLGT